VAADPRAAAVVSHRGQRWELAPGEVFTFGRAATCTVALDAADTGISRLAGSVEHGAGTWWVVNRSSARPLTASDELGMRSVIAPGGRLAVAGPLTVVVEGAVRRHAIGVAVEGAPAFGLTLEPSPEALPTDTADRVIINDADRLALVALLVGYLEPFPRYDPHPRSYADAATELGWPRTTLIKRIEHLRTRLSDAGVPNLRGETALEHLAEWALTTRIVTRDDLVLLRPGAGRP
jgi:hypothetical protein